MFVTEYGTIKISLESLRETRMQQSLRITGDLSISLIGSETGKPYPRFILVRFGKRKNRSERSFLMKTETLFGGAIVGLNVSSATEDTAANPKIGPTLVSFLELYRLAHNYGEDERFSQIYEVFLDETLTYLEDRHIGKDEGGVWDLVGEMEDFMNQRYEKKDKE
jgi:hypothetical protein